MSAVRHPSIAIVLLAACALWLSGCHETVEVQALEQAPVFRAAEREASEGPPLAPGAVESANRSTFPESKWFRLADDGGGARFVHRDDVARLPLQGRSASVLIDKPQLTWFDSDDAPPTPPAFGSELTAGPDANGNPTLLIRNGRAVGTAPTGSLTFETFTPSTFIRAAQAALVDKWNVSDARRLMAAGRERFKDDKALRALDDALNNRLTSIDFPSVVPLKPIEVGAQAWAREATAALSKTDGFEGWIPRGYPMKVVSVIGARAQVLLGLPERAFIDEPHELPRFDVAKETVTAWVDVGDLDGARPTGKALGDAATARAKAGEHEAAVSLIRPLAHRWALKGGVKKQLVPSVLATQRYDLLQQLLTWKVPPSARYVAMPPDAWERHREKMAQSDGLEAVIMRASLADGPQITISNLGLTYRCRGGYALTEPVRYWGDIPEGVNPKKGEVCLYAWQQQIVSPELWAAQQAGFEGDDDEERAELEKDYDEEKRAMDAWRAAVAEQFPLPGAVAVELNIDKGSRWNAFVAGPVSFDDDGEGGGGIPWPRQDDPRGALPVPTFASVKAFTIWRLGAPGIDKYVAVSVGLWPSGESPSTMSIRQWVRWVSTMRYEGAKYFTLRGFDAENDDVDPYQPRGAVVGVDRTLAPGQVFEGIDGSLVQTLRLQPLEDGFFLMTLWLRDGACVDGGAWKVFLGETDEDLANANGDGGAPPPAFKTLRPPDARTIDVAIAADHAWAELKRFDASCATTTKRMVKK